MSDFDDEELARRQWGSAFYDDVKGLGNIGARVKRNWEVATDNVPAETRGYPGFTHPEETDASVVQASMPSRSNDDGLLRRAPKVVIEEPPPPVSFPEKTKMKTDQASGARKQNKPSKDWAPAGEVSGLDAGVGDSAVVDVVLEPQPVQQAATPTAQPIPLPQQDISDVSRKADLALKQNREISADVKATKALGMLERLSADSRGAAPGKNFSGGRLDGKKVASIIAAIYTMGASTAASAAVGAVASEGMKDSKSADAAPISTATTRNSFSASESRPGATEIASTSNKIGVPSFTSDSKAAQAYLSPQASPTSDITKFGAVPSATSDPGAAQAFMSANGPKMEKTSSLPTGAAKKAGGGMGGVMNIASTVLGILGAVKPDDGPPSSPLILK